MADLDAFFAKRDKKRAKKSQFQIPDKLINTLEGRSKRDSALAKSMQLEMTAASGTAATVVSGAGSANVEVVATNPEVKPLLENDEWNNFEETKPKDYTGLKIVQLPMEEKDDGYLAYGESAYNNSAVPIPKHSGGFAWKSLIQSKQVPEMPVEKPKPPVYVPAPLRNAQLKLRRGKEPESVAPDITNADYFPELGTGSPRSEKPRQKKNAATEEVRHVKRMQQRTKEPALPMSHAANSRFRTPGEE